MTARGEKRRQTPVPVVGMGCITVAGPSLQATMAGFAAPATGLQPPSLFATGCTHPVFQCAMPESPDQWKKSLHYSHNLPALDMVNRTTQLALLATDAALHHACLPPKLIRGKRVGVCIGTSVGASLDFFDYYKDLVTDKNAKDPGTIPRYGRSNPALAVKYLLGLEGPAMTVTNACSSGADAIGLAASWLQNDLCDLALAGGADALSYITYLGFRSLKILAPDACKPFDKNRNGLNIGEGAGMLVLKKPDAAIAKTTDFGAILSYGTATDAYHLTAPHPEATGLQTALHTALEGAGLAPEQIAFINAHGTGTPTNDQVEGNFFQKFFPTTPFISSKGLTGHTLGAAGAIEAIIALAHLHLGQLPPSPGFAEADLEAGRPPSREHIPVQGDIALSQSLAFGGNNSVLILKKGTAPCLWQ